MKKELVLISLLICVSADFLIAQMIIPKFGPAEKQELFSSDEEESMPLPFNDGTSIYFYRTYIEGTGNKTTVTGQDIWYSTKGKKGWEKPYRLFREGDLEGQNSIIGTTSNGERIYFFNTTYTSDTSYRKLVFIDKEGKNKWSEPTEIKIPGLEYGEKYYSFYINPTEEVILVSMSPSEKTLDEDLYVSLKNEKGEWGKLISLGSTVNSKRFEVSPYISNDLKTLYFSSNGHGGFGASDIFVSRRLDDTWQNWSKPLNLGEPINSNGYDAFFTMGNNREVYFTSSRNSAHSNIYKATATGEFIFANADSINGSFVFKGLPAENIRLIIEDSEGNFVDEIITDVYGRFKFKKLEEEENYLIKLDVEEDELYLGSKIYFVDATGIKTKRFIYTESKRFVKDKKLKKENNITGVFNFNDSPAGKYALVVTDDSGFILDTILTNSKGEFGKKFSKYDYGISLSPLNMTSEDYESVELYLTDKNGNKVQELKPGKVHRLEDELLIKQVKKVEDVTSVKSDTPLMKGGGMGVEVWKGMSPEDRAIYFDFRALKASDKELKKLLPLIELLKVDKELEVQLTGHTDNVGEEKVNLKVGMNRANSVKRFLVRKGIGASRIKVNSMGERYPTGDNSSEIEKAKNRRVEILIQ